MYVYYSQLYIRIAKSTRTQAKWSKLEGDGDLRWADAELTEDGISQAGRFKSAWASHIETQKTSLPQTFYTSPLIRACRTTEIMVSEPRLFGKQFVPKIVVKEVRWNLS